MNKKAKAKEKGSIILFVIIAIFFILIMLMQIYFKKMNEIKKQEEGIKQIQKLYEDSIDLNERYEGIYK